MSAAQCEATSIFVEELGEALQALGKKMRFGDSPTHEGITYDNRADLKRECIDVMLGIALLEFTEIITLGDDASTELMLAKAGNMNLREIDQEAFLGFVREVVL